MKTFEQLRDEIAYSLYGYFSYSDFVKSIPVRSSPLNQSLIHLDNINREAAKEYSTQFIMPKWRKVEIMIGCIVISITFGLIIAFTVIKYL